MKWIYAADLDKWANSVISRTSLSELVSSLIRASSPNPRSFHFPTGDSAQLPGYDGSLESEGVDPYIPEGNSVWEFGTEADPRRKAEKDYATRTQNPRDAVPANTTFVFVTPRKWPGGNAWAQEKTDEKVWKQVRTIDGVALEDWLERSPAVAAKMARERMLQLMPNNGVRSTDEFWDQYASTFEPSLTELVALAGRSEQSKLLVQELQDIPHAYLWQADSLEEVIAFAVAAIRNANPEVRKYLEAKTLVVDTRDAAQQLANRTDLLFLVRGSATDLSGLLGKRTPVIVPIGRDQPNRDNANKLIRPHFEELAEALKTMGLAEKQAEQIARECGRSVTILARRIPSACSRPPSWSTDRTLLPALIAGGWNVASAQDIDALQMLLDNVSYDVYETQLLSYLRVEDPPLDRVGDAWQMRSPVDAFVHLAHLISAHDLKKFEEVLIHVFSEADPSINLPADERFYAGIKGKKLKHSDWLRNGLATTLLLFSEFHNEAGLEISGMSPPEFVNKLISSIPGLSTDYHVIASLYGVLPTIAEAAPRPLLQALGRLIEGEGELIAPIFQDHGTDSFRSSSPHTALLWALEVLAWDPLYLTEVSLILAGLARIDPGGSLMNRPINTLREIFLVWHPGTNANLEQRVAALDEVIRREPQVAWDLLVKLLPEFHGIASTTAKPRYREAGSSNAEVVTYGVVGRAYKQIVERLLAQVGDDSTRWAAVIQQLPSFSPEDRAKAIELLEDLSANNRATDQTLVWASLRSMIHRHRRFRTAEWALSGPDLQRLELILAKLEPQDIFTQLTWLFDQYHPDLPDANPEDQWNTLQTRRKDAVKRVADNKGLSGVLTLASKVKMPASVGYAFADVATLDEVEALINNFLEQDPTPNDLLIAVSAGADFRSRDGWRIRIANCHRFQSWSPAQIGLLSLGLADDLETWKFIEAQGKEVERVYWSHKMSRPTKGDVDAQEFMAAKYLLYNRAVAALDSISYSASVVSSETLFRVLDTSISEINETPSLVSNNLEYELSTIFAALRSRDNVSPLEIAKREYAYLPLLGFRPHNLTIHTLLVKDAHFFVSVLCDVFKPASGENREPTEERRAKARAGFTLLADCKLVPGLKDQTIEYGDLTSWITKARELAGLEDRAAIADEYIGHMLAHAPFDSDGAWPHRVVRDVIEDIASPKVEQGIRIERFNMRGVTSRGMHDGGDQERALAATIREWSRLTFKWPRTTRLLEDMAQNWERHAEDEDIRTKHDEMLFS